MGSNCVRPKHHKHSEIAEAVSSENRSTLRFGPKSREVDSVTTLRVSQDNTDAQFARVDDKSKTPEDIAFIQIALSKHFIFTNLTDEQRDSTIRHMKYYSLEPNEIVFQQGSAGTIFFIVVNGKLEVLIDNEKVNTLRPQDSFGELALIHDKPRTATVRTLENTSLWGLDRKTFRSTLDQLNAQDYAENRKLLESIPVFKILSDAQMESLISSISISMYAPGKVIVNEGETGDLLYIIKQGSVVCSQGNTKGRTLEKGDYFGEKALLGNSNIRTATIMASENVKCLTIGRNDLTALLGTSLQLIVHKNSERIAFDKNNYLNKLTMRQFENLINSTEYKNFKSDEKVIIEGSLKNKEMLIVLKGSLKDFSGSVSINTYDIIGVEDIIMRQVNYFHSDYFANGEVDIGIIDSSAFFEAIGGDYEKVISNNETINLLKKIQLFRNLAEEQFDSLLNLLRLEEFPPDTIIFNENEPGESLYLIKEGTVNIYKNNKILRTITKNDYFGERSLLVDDFRSATVKARSQVICWALYKSDFLGLLDANLKFLLYKRIQLQDDTIKLDELQIVKSIGKGVFGNVFLVVHKTKRTLFALKTVNKKKIQAYEIEANILLERKILLQIDHVLIVKLVKTFKDKERLYFLCEFINGVNLCEVLNKLDVVSVADAKFYTACIFSMLEHLHERNIIYRDLNPENIMIDDEGYPKLIDFGTAKIVKNRTYTIVSTPAHYMAPEIVSGHGYTLSSDYWSLGVILFEFLFAYMPFGQDLNDPYMIYESILQEKLSFPEASDNKDKVKDLISQLLSKNPGSRLVGGFEAIKFHPWFISINWGKILRQALPTPYRPLLLDMKSSIESALKQKGNLESIISVIEKNEVIPKIRLTSNRFAANWDDEFNT